MSDNKNSRSDLHKKIDELSERELDVVGRFVNAVTRPVDIEPLPLTWLATEEWRETFAILLKLHHANSEKPLATTPFEAAFTRACEEAGWHVGQTGSATQRFYDATLSKGRDPERRLSLKTSSAKNVRPNVIEISKLTEAAWIQDVRKQADRRGSIVDIFRQYREETSAIFMLRCFNNPEYSFFYELVEIPTSIFNEVDKLTIRQAQEGTINLPPGSSSRERDFGIGIDGSDSKIKLTGIRLEICIVHGRWGLK